MIDVNKITSTLAKLPDAQLQQYAQMHKADPYIMSLAMSESNRRKEMRAASQAPAQQEQPKVVDQGIAAMAPQPAPQQMAQAMPEDQGIAQIPAGNMNFAGGGIIAFADGGDVERYQVGGQTGSWVDTFLYGNITPAERARRERLQAEANAGRLPTPYEQERAANMAAATAGSTYTPEAYGVTAPAPAFQDPRLLGAPTTAATEKGLASADKATLTPPTAVRPGAAPSAAPGIGMPSYASMDVGKMTRKALEEVGTQAHPQAKELGEIGTAKVKAKEEEVTGLEAIQQKYNDIFKGRKERLDTKEGEIAKMGDQSLGLALLQAGAAMMTTPGGIGAALGKGVEVGSKQYVAGLDKINAAKDKLSDARDRVEEIDAQRGEMSARELFKARNAVKSTQIDAKEDMVKANMQMYGLNREQALKQVDNQIKINLSEIEQKGLTERAKAQLAATTAAANRTPEGMQMIERIMAEKKIPFSEALAYVSTAKREGVSEEKLRGEWLDPTKRMQISQDYPNVKSFEDYKTVMGGGTGGGGGAFKVVGVR